MEPATVETKDDLEHLLRMGLRGLKSSGRSADGRGHTTWHLGLDRDRANLPWTYLMMVCEETVVRRNQHRIYVRDYPGAGPPILLMHGFPDNLHLYDRLVPYLSPPPRRIV